MGIEVSIVRAPHVIVTHAHERNGVRRDGTDPTDG